MAENLEVGEFFSDDEELIELGKKWDAAAMAYWERYHQIRSHKPGAVLYLHNHENGHFMVFTRGEYVPQIKRGIIEAYSEMP